MENQTKIMNELTLPIVGIKELHMPIIQADFQGKKLLFLIDSGSDTNLVDERLYILYKECMKIEDAEGYVLGIGGENPRGPKVSMRIGLAGQSIPISCWTMQFPTFDILHKESGVQVHGILGLEFMVKHGALIDFRANVVKLRQAGETASNGSAQSCANNLHD